jgi:hypothetical protein
MLKSGKTPPVPSFTEVEAKLVDLIDGRCSRQEASDWARQWVGLIDTLDMDDAMYDALDSLYGADLPDLDRSYLYSETDFQRWLKELREHS